MQVCRFWRTSTRPEPCTCALEARVNLRKSSIVVLLFTLSAFAAIPQVTGTNPTIGPTGTQVQISGSGFGSSQSTVAFNGVNATIVNWSDTLITANVPAAA